jgi:hypothetical protein
MRPYPQPEINHRGKAEYRLPTNPREEIFAKAWLEKQTQCHTLQWLLCASPEQDTQERDLTQPEATCAATLMQWLGSPVGFSWLEETVRKCGYELREVKR